MLLTHLLRFPRAPERERGRFDLAHRIAGRVPVIPLTARSALPADLAAAVLTAVDHLDDLDHRDPGMRS